MTEWISVEDRLPEKGQIVLLSDGGQITMGWFSKKNNKIRQCNTWRDLTFQITHWMLSPDLPNEQ